MAKLEYESKYNVGDRLFVVDEDKKLCPTCICYHKHYFVREAVIERVSVSYCGIEYWTEIIINKNAQRCMSLSEFHFFTNREDAQKQCDYKNAELLKDKKKYLKYL